MKVLFVGVLMSVVFLATLAFGAPEPRALVTGTTPQYWDAGTSMANGRLIAQCPLQVITFRPMATGDVHDSGIYDVRMDFILNPDPYPIALTSTQTQVIFRNIDGGSMDCRLFNNL